MLTSELAYVAAVSRDVDAAANVLGNVLELPRVDVPGPGRDVPSSPPGGAPSPCSRPATPVSTARTAPEYITSPSGPATPRQLATRRPRPGSARVRSARPSAAAMPAISTPPRRAASSPG